MSKKKPKAVVDTNLFISSIIIPRGNPYAILKALQAKKFDLIMSVELFLELETVLKRPKYQKVYGINTDKRNLFLKLINVFLKKLSLPLQFLFLLEIQRMKKLSPQQLLGRHNSL